MVEGDLNLGLVEDVISLWSIDNYKYWKMFSVFVLAFREVSVAMGDLLNQSLYKTFSRPSPIYHHGYGAATSWSSWRKILHPSQKLLQSSLCLSPYWNPGASDENTCLREDFGVGFVWSFVLVCVCCCESGKWPALRTYAPTRLKYSGLSSPQIFYGFISLYTSQETYFMYDYMYVLYGFVG